MQAYLNQLLADLQAAEHRQPPPIDYRLLHPEYADVPDELAYVVEWEQAPEQSCEELFGIRAEAFPPVEKLTDEQAVQLAEAILKLWAAWNIYTDIPEGVPVRICYQVLTDFWRDETLCYVSEGRISLDLCSYDPQECPWGEAYCTCRELEEELEDGY